MGAAPFLQHPEPARLVKMYVGQLLIIMRIVALQVLLTVATDAIQLPLIHAQQRNHPNLQRWEMGAP